MKLDRAWPQKKNEPKIMKIRQVVPILLTLEVFLKVTIDFNEKNG